MVRNDPIPVALLWVGGKVWPISGSPLKPLALPQNRYLIRVVRISANVLEFAPTLLARFFGILLMGISLALLIGRITLVVKDAKPFDWSWQAPVVVVFFLAFVIAFACHGLYVFSNRTTFDWNTRQWIRRSALGTQPFIPLDNLLAVQCLYVCHRTAKGSSFEVYEVNLAWKTPTVDRKTVRVESNPKRTRELAAVLAEFLRVHLVDQIDSTKAHVERNKVRWW